MICRPLAADYPPGRPDGFARNKPAGGRRIVLGKDWMESLRLLTGCKNGAPAFRFCHTGGRLINRVAASGLEERPYNRTSRDDPSPPARFSWRAFDLQPNRHRRESAPFTTFSQSRGQTGDTWFDKLKAMACTLRRPAVGTFGSGKSLLRTSPVAQQYKRSHRGRVSPTGTECALPQRPKTCADNPRFRSTD